MLTLKSSKKGINSLDLKDLGSDWVLGHALDEFNFIQFLILVLVSLEEYLRHSHGHVHVSSVHPNLDEKGHHIEQLFNTDVAVTIFIKEVEHLSEIVLSLAITEEVDKQGYAVDWNGAVCLLNISNLLNKSI